MYCNKPNITYLLTYCIFHEFMRPSIIMWVHDVPVFSMSNCLFGIMQPMISHSVSLRFVSFDLYQHLWVDPSNPSTHILQDYFTGTGTWLSNASEVTLNDTINPLHAKYFRGNIKHIFTFHVIPPYWCDTGGWNPSSNKTRTYPFYIVNIMAAGVLAT